MWSWLLSPLTPQGPSLFSFYSSRSPPAPPPPFCPTALSVYGCMNRSISLPKSQLTSNPTIALIIEVPPPHCAFISMTTHKEERERGRRRKIAEAGKNVNERVGVTSVDLWFNCEEGNIDYNSQIFSKVKLATPAALLIVQGTSCSFFVKYSKNCCTSVNKKNKVNGKK